MKVKIESPGSSWHDQVGIVIEFDGTWRLVNFNNERDSTWFKDTECEFYE